MHPGPSMKINYDDNDNDIDDDDNDDNSLFEKAINPYLDFGGHWNKIKKYRYEANIDKNTTKHRAFKKKRESHINS